MRRLAEFDSWVVSELQKHAAAGLTSEELHQRSVTTHWVVRRSVMGLYGDGHVLPEPETGRFRATESGLAALAAGPREPVSWREFMDGGTHSLSLQELDAYGMSVPEFEIRLHIYAVTRGLAVIRIAPAPEGMATSFRVETPIEGPHVRKRPRTRNLPRTLFREAVEKWTDGEPHSVGVEELSERFQLSPDQFRRKLYAYAFDNGLVVKVRKAGGMVTLCMGTMDQVRTASVPKKVRAEYALDPNLMNKVTEYVTWRSALSEVVPSESPANTVDVVRELFQSSRPASRYLAALEKEGRITSEREGKYRYWQPAPA
ncbi:winged helix-turn-helix domain-containing protein [Streptomyces sp. NPDC127039]|uniref:helix-turn-helix domain-containing protein n=1 Tax=Streptomyces sp. NPDC127039 TaxID=3347115 RepID=UPI00365EA38A